MEVNNYLAKYSYKAKNSLLIDLVVELFKKSIYYSKSLFLIFLMSKALVVQAGIAQNNDQPESLSSSLSSAKEVYQTDPQKGIEFAAELYSKAKVSGNPSSILQTGSVYAFFILKSGQALKAHDIYAFIIDSLNIAIPDSLKADLLKNYATTHFYLGEFHTSKSLYEELLVYAKGKSDTLSVANALTSLGAVTIRTGNLDKSLEYSQEALKYYLQITDKKGQAFVLNNIGGIYSYLAMNDTAKNYFLQSLKLNEELQDSFTMATLLMNLASISRAEGNLEESLKEDLKALQIAEKIQNKSLVPRLILAVSKDYIALDMFDKAEGLLIEGFGKCLTSGNQYDEMHFRSTLGQLYYKKRQPTKALTYLQPGLDLAELKNNHEMLSELNFNISEVYASMGNYKKAYESYMKYHSHYDSIYNEKSVARLNELEMQYQNKKNEVEIAALRSEHAVYDLELKRDHLERSLLWAIIVFIAGSMVLLAFFYSSTRKSGKLLRQKNKQLAEAIAIKNKLFSIVAHDLKNPLNSIIGFSTLIASGQEDKESVTNYAGYIKSSGIQSFEMIERLLEWSRLNLNEIPFNIKRNDLFETVGRAAKDISNFASMKSIKINNGIKESTYCFYDENSIYSVLVNLLSNAIKFSYDNSEVSISAFKKDDFMVISVHDNGIGISNDIKEQLNGHGITQSSPGTRDEKGTGLGLSISKEFISKNGGVLLIESSEGTGTTVTFSLKANP